MGIVLTCECGHQFRSDGADTKGSAKCTKCGKFVSRQGGYPPRMCLYERGYRDYVRYLRSLRNMFGGIRKGAWKWFWKGFGARITEMVIHLCVILLIFAVGIVYVVFEARQGRSLGPRTLGGACFVILYVGLLAWGWERPFFFVTRLSSGACTAGSIIGFGTAAVFAAAVVFSVYLLTLFLITVLSAFFFIPMWGARLLYMYRHNITYRCPYGCPEQGRKLPVHICECGQEYRDLEPNFYGIFYHKCRHDDGYHKLPTMDFRGRNLLRRRCAGCRHEVTHKSWGIARPLTLAVVGAPKAGKTVLIAQAVRQLCMFVREVPGASIRIDSDPQRTTLKKWCQGLDQGDLPEETLSKMTEAIGVAITTPHQGRILMQIFEIPGADCLEFAKLSRKQVMQRLDGILLLWDARALPRLGARGDSSGDNDMPESHLHETVAGNLTQLLGTMRRRGRDDKCDIRLAVVLGRIDELPVEWHSTLVPSRSQGESASRFANRLHESCLDTTKTLGWESMVHMLEQKFSYVRYYACSGLGRKVDPSKREPFKPIGVVRPFSYLLNLTKLMHNWP
jgi:hypothetical protein